MSAHVPTIEQYRAVAEERRRAAEQRRAEGAVEEIRRVAAEEAEYQRRAAETHPVTFRTFGSDDYGRNQEPAVPC